MRNRAIQIANYGGLVSIRHPRGIKPTKIEKRAGIWKCDVMPSHEFNSAEQAVHFVFDTYEQYNIEIEGAE